ncbi:hypothetical protein U1Q18_008819 [Sarracenia purpurea var. burkii]
MVTRLIGFVVKLENTVREYEESNMLSKVFVGIRVLDQATFLLMLVMLSYGAYGLQSSVGLGHAQISVAVSSWRYKCCQLMSILHK